MSEMYEKPCQFPSSLDSPLGKDPGRRRVLWSWLDQHENLEDVAEEESSQSLLSFFFKKKRSFPFLCISLIRSPRRRA